jgi:hypothetical protein
MKKTKQRVFSIGAPTRPAQTEMTPDGVRTMRLLDYRYDEARKLILWHLQDETPGTPVEWRQITYAWLVHDLLAQFNIRLGNLKPEEQAKLPQVVLGFSKNVKDRPWPFKIRPESTAQLVDPDEWKKVSTEDWKDELQRVKAGEEYNAERLLPSNQKLLQAHDDMDRYPFHEVQSMLYDEQQKGRRR